MKDWRAIGWQNWLLTGPLVANMAFIWDNSLLSPEKSWTFSNGVKDVLLAC